MQLDGSNNHLVTTSRLLLKCKQTRKKLHGIRNSTKTKIETWIKLFIVGN